MLRKTSTWRRQSVQDGLLFSHASKQLASGHGKDNPRPNEIEVFFHGQGPEVIKPTKVSLARPAHSHIGENAVAAMNIFIIKISRVGF